MTDDATNFHDGSVGSDGLRFAGRIDEVRIGDHVFASDEVESLWELPGDAAHNRRVGTGG